MSSARLQNNLQKIDGVGENIAKELIEKGVKKLSDLKKPEYQILLPEEAKISLKYDIEKQNSWDFINSLVAQLPDYVIPAGSYRRKAPIIKDVDVVVLAKSLEEVVEDLKNRHRAGESALEVIDEYASGDKKRSIIVKFMNKYLRMDLFHTTEKELPFALLHWTGSKNFNIRIRKHAKNQGYKLSQYGLFKGIKRIPAKSERDIMRIIGVSYKPPEMRNE